MATSVITPQVKKKQRKKATVKKKVLKKISFWKNKQQLMGLAFVLVVTFIAFIPSLQNDFVNWDDDVNIMENVNLDGFTMENVKRIFHPSTGTVIGNYNPLPIFTFAIEKHFFGLDATPFHVNNLILHLITTLLVFRILLMMKISTPAAIVGALLFGIHPMRVESVAWVTERKDVLLGVFYFSAIYTYIKYIVSKGKAKKYFIYTIGLFVIALFSKIQAVSLPLSMLALDYYFKRPFSFKLVMEKVPFFGLSLLFGLMGIFFLAENSSLDDITNYTFFERLLVGAYSFIIYLAKFVFPYKMSCLYPYPKAISGAFYAAPIGVFAILGGIFYAYKKQMKHVVFGLVFFIFNIMFLLQVLSAGQGYLADRFTYIAYFGLFFMVGYAFDQLLKWKPNLQTFMSIGVGAYLLLFMGMTWQQNKTWKNGETLWSNVLKTEKKTTTPWSNRAFYYRDIKKYDKALLDYNKAIQINPSKATLYNSRGKLYFDIGKTQECINDYNQATQLDPTLTEAWINRGAAYASQGNLKQALSDFNKGIEIDPTYENGYMNRSLLFNQSQQFDKALQDYNAYLKLRPNNAEMLYERAITKRALGTYEAALVDINKAIALKGQQTAYMTEKNLIISLMRN